MGRHSDCPRDTSAKADVGPHLRVSSPACHSSDMMSLGEYNQAFLDA